MKALNNNDLKNLISTYDHLLIDGFALQKKAFESAYDNVLAPLLKEAKKRIYIPQNVVEKLKEDSRIYDKFLIKQTYLAEAIIKDLSTALKDSKKLLVFVGDKKSGNIVLRYKRHKAIFFSKDGFSYFTKSTQVSQTARKKQKGLNTKKATIKAQIPKENMKVYCENNNKLNLTKEIILQNELASGGEGNVYITNTKFIAKVYKLNERSKNELKIPLYTLEKLKKFEKVKLDSKLSPFIFLPLLRIFNDKNECVGFLMNKANAKPVQYILGSSKEREKHYPNCEYKNLVKMCINYLKLTIELHKKDIIIGDVNMNNVLFDTQDNVYLIDCDSFQIEGYPCPVATQEFLHPAHRGKHMNDFVRSLADEYYAICIFIFMLLHCGVYPYNTKGALSRDDAQKDMKFPYIDSKNAPDKGLKYWNRLDSTLKDYFINTFNKGGKYTTEKSILSPEKWLKALESFYKSL